MFHEHLHGKLGSSHVDGRDVQGDLVLSVLIFPHQVLELVMVFLAIKKTSALKGTHLSLLTDDSLVVSCCRRRANEISTLNHWVVSVLLPLHPRHLALTPSHLAEVRI